MSPAPTSPAREQELLKAAREGDEGAYGNLVEPHRGELHAHCYRMLGSVHDAEDALQEAMLRAWRGLPRFAGRSSLRSWLYKIATNTCLDAIARRPKRILPPAHGPAADPDDGPGEPLVESVWIEPYPDEVLGVEDGPAAPEARYERREGMELAFIAALQHLPANQRAVLILREVLGFAAQEVADSLDTSVASVNSALQRARSAVEERVPEQTQQATLRALGDDELRATVESYMEAMQNNDVDAVMALLAHDSAWSMPPASTWYAGVRMLDFLNMGPLSGDWHWRHAPARANGQPAAGAYAWDPERGDYRPFALNVLAFEGARIKEITSFIVRTAELPDRAAYRRWPEYPEDPAMREAMFTRFGLPDRLEGPAPDR